MSSFVTAGIRRMGEGTVYSLFVSSHFDWTGVPHLADRGGGGYPPIGTEWGYPLLRLDGTPPPPQLGLDGVPPIRTGWGYPPPRKETEQQSEYLVRGGVMPLAFTQEDFLVLVCSRFRRINSACTCYIC